MWGRHIYNEHLNISLTKSICNLFKWIPEYYVHRYNFICFNAFSLPETHKHKHKHYTCEVKFVRNKSKNNNRTAQTYWSRSFIHLICDRRRRMKKKVKMQMEKYEPFRMTTKITKENVPKRKKKLKSVLLLCFVCFQKEFQMKYEPINGANGSWHLK